MPRDQRGPLNILFANTSMPIGGAETLQEQLIRNLPRESFNPSICCLKELGSLGEKLSRDFPVYSNLIGGKYDFRVLGRLSRLMDEEGIDGIVTVGAGDKMFWGRLAAYRRRLPIVVSAIHSTGWPDVIGRLNRSLTSITDAFVAVAQQHGEFLVDQERFPAQKVCVIPNGIDTNRFRFDPVQRAEIRKEYNIPSSVKCVGLVAALRPEKDHQLFLQVAKRVRRRLPDCHFLLIGEGPEDPFIRQSIDAHGLQDCVTLAGARRDVEACLSSMDAFLLTSQMEANPVSILEALAVERPVIATDVGSVASSVQQDKTGYVAPAGDAEQLAEACCRVLHDEELAARLGRQGRRWVEHHGSLHAMVDGYAELFRGIYDAKIQRVPWRDTPEIVSLPTRTASAEAATVMSA